MLIDCSYFTKGLRHILNATLGTVPNAGQLLVRQVIEGYIEEHQEQYLVGVLGRTLGNKVHNYLICLDGDEEPKHNDNIDAVCDKLRESFADYVFFHILQESNSEATITGLVQLKNENRYLSPISKQVIVWNSMVDKHRLFIAWSSSSECQISDINTSAEMLTKINPFNL